MRASIDKRFGPQNRTPGVIKSPRPIAETALIQAQAAFCMGSDLRGITILASALVAIQDGKAWRVPAVLGPVVIRSKK